MFDDNEGNYDDGSLKRQREFWLEQGRKILSNQIGAIQSAAKGIMTALALLSAVYIAVLGLSDCTPKSMPVIQRSLFMTPPLFWLAAFYYCLRMLMAERYDINLRSPEDIRTKSEYILEDKHDNLQWAYWLMLAGLLVASLLLIFRIRP
ncbi:MAG TPA: hypothetical protein VMX13_02810 [Sedimentisphaerales bacterium]|nr:hypothetical protein [Sedimentisphaerales bacterium]